MSGIEAVFTSFTSMSDVRSLFIRRVFNHVDCDDDVKLVNGRWIWKQISSNYILEGMNM